MVLRRGVGDFPVDKGVLAGTTGLEPELRTGSKRQRAASV